MTNCNVAVRLQDAKGWQPEKERPRKVSVALQAYAAMTTSAARGAVRDVR
jgi:dihydroxy-acid dehydratase